MKKLKLNGYGKVFLLCAGTAALIFLPAIVWDRGYFIFLGDFNSQQIPFYKTAHAAIRSGNFGWNWYTDLGVNFIGSYSFYLMGSPFFWLTIPFPNDFVPYLMGPLLILKFACAGLTSYAWLKRYVKNPDCAVIGALLYAFSGFSIYNIFFNHFHEAIVFFPLLLIGLDERMDYGTRGVFALAVFINAFVSYFFFVGEVVFVLIYFFVRCLMKSYRLSLKSFLYVAFEAVVGFLMSMVLFLPSLFVMLSNSRVQNYPLGFDVWVYWNELKLPAVLSSFFIPNDLPSKPVFFKDAGIKWSSLSAYLPLFGAGGAIAYLNSHKKNWLKTLLIILVVMACVPGLNSLFVAFNKSYYARWFYMLVLMMVLATVLMLDQQRVRQLERGTVVTMIATTFIILAIGFTPQELKDGSIRIGLYDEECLLQFAVMAVFAMVSLGLLLLFSDNLLKNPRKFAVQCVTAICILSVLYGNFYVIWGKARGYDTHNYYIPDALEGKKNIHLGDDGEFFRIDADDSLINIGMFWELPCIRAFHSLVPASIMEFYEYVGEQRDVNSKPSYENYALRSLFSVRYFVDARDAGDHFETTTETDDTVFYDYKMPGYVYVDEQSDYDIYENINFIPMGFTYDHYVLAEEAERVAEKSRSVMMLDSLILSEEQAQRYGSLLSRVDDALSIDTSETAFARYCEERAMHSANSFSWDRHGFEASIYSETPDLLFFSVPYEEGWSAKVNGEDAVIEKVNVGFMAVEIPEGASRVEFRYETPGLKTGAWISLGAALIFAAYLALGRIHREKRGKR